MPSLPIGTKTKTEGQTVSASLRLTTADALAAAQETRALEIGQRVLGRVPSMFQQYFAGRPAVVVADKRTFAAAGHTVQEALRAAGQPTIEPFIFADDDLYAEHRFVERLEASLRCHSAIPVAAGAGTINDLVKLASHRCGRQYLCVATAASMDGYTAYGASITYQGSKQTFDCPAPIGVVADLDVIAAAPTDMKAWGYADLLAKVTAGADWIVADMLGVEPIAELPWNIVQGGLRQAVGDPVGIGAGDPAALAALVEGLMLGGFAMQAMRSSRPASGAEHQFSHLWDMQHHTHNGQAPSHGQKVGIATVAVTALYEELLACPAMPISPSDAVAQWLSLIGRSKTIAELFDDPKLRDLAEQESRAKWIDRDALLVQLKELQQRWPELCERLREQLIPLQQLREMLSSVGAPVEPEAIGISRERLRGSFRQAQMIRRRFTILDLALRLGKLDEWASNVTTGCQTAPSSPALLPRSTEGEGSQILDDDLPYDSN